MKIKTRKSQSRFLNWPGSFGSGITERQHLPTTPKKQPQEYPVTVEIGGKRYTGFYTVSSGVVSVEADWGERSTQADPRAEQTARLLLVEVLRRAKVPVTLLPPLILKRPATFTFMAVIGNAGVTGAGSRGGFTSTYNQS